MLEMLTAALALALGFGSLAARRPCGKCRGMDGWMAAPYHIPKCNDPYVM